MRPNSKARTEIDITHNTYNAWVWPVCGSQIDGGWHDLSFVLCSWRPIAPLLLVIGVFGYGFATNQGHLYTNAFACWQSGAYCVLVLLPRTPRLSSMWKNVPCERRKKRWHIWLKRWNKSLFEVADVGLRTPDYLCRIDAGNEPNSNSNSPKRTRKNYKK